MTRRLEEVFDIAPTQKDEPEKASSEPQLEPEVVNAITVVEKIEHALSTVSGLSQHDVEMDEIFNTAIEAYEECKNLALSSHDAHASKMMEAAATMLKTALEARDSKSNRKLKVVELQLKKAKLDLDTKKQQNNNDSPTLEPGHEFDRNELLKHLRKQ